MVSFIIQKGIKILFFFEGWWFVKNEDRTGFAPGAFLESTEQQRGVRDSKLFQTSLGEYQYNFKRCGKSVIVRNTDTA
jgi:hypothetical protein